MGPTLSSQLAKPCTSPEGRVYTAQRTLHTGLTASLSGVRARTLTYKFIGCLLHNL